MASRCIPEEMNWHIDTEMDMLIDEMPNITKERGFTLIELMIVVAIIGILAAIAIPNFLRFSGRARQSEAKMMLAGMVRAQYAHRQDHGRFTDNIAAMIWNPTGSPVYVYGFTSDNSSSGCNDTSECGSGFRTDKMIDAFGVPLTSAELPPSAATDNQFTIGATGNLDNDSTLDTWTLNTSNVLINVSADLD